MNNILKHIMVISIALLLFSSTKAQTPYIRLKDPKDTSVVMIKGLMSKYLLMNDPAFKWYASAHDGFRGDSVVVSNMSHGAGKVQLFVFGGTWCDDSQYILPRFFRLQELSGIPDSTISFFGVDRDKKTLAGISEAMQITNVPTFIVFKNGKEIGRVVEYGKTGKWDAELASIIQQAAN